MWCFFFFLLLHVKTVRVWNFCATQPAFLWCINHFHSQTTHEVARMKIENLQSHSSSWNIKNKRKYFTTFSIVSGASLSFYWISKENENMERRKKCLVFLHFTSWYRVRCYFSELEIIVRLNHKSKTEKLWEYFMTCDISTKAHNNETKSLPYFVLLVHIMNISFDIEHEENWKFFLMIFFHVKIKLQFFPKLWRFKWTAEKWKFDEHDHRYFAQNTILSIHKTPSVFIWYHLNSSHVPYNPRRSNSQLFLPANSLKEFYWAISIVCSEFWMMEIFFSHRPWKRLNSQM